MAYIEKTAFEARVTNGPYNALENITGVFHNGSQVTEICSAGFLVKRTTQVPNEGYTGINNDNTWYMEAAAATDLMPTAIFACDPYQVNEVQGGNGNVYKVGANTLGLALPAGAFGTFRNIVFDGLHIYRFGEGNLSAAISTNKFFTIANGLLVPAASAPTADGTPYFELIGTGSFTEGAMSAFTYYDVVAKYVMADTTGGEG